MKNRIKNSGILVLLIATLVISSTAVVIAADYIVAPPDHETTGGSSNNVFPIGYGSAWRYQQLYLPSELSGESGTITNVYFRTDEYYGNNPTYVNQVTLYNLEISLGNTPVTSASSNFNTNIAGCVDWTLVYREPTTVVTPIRQVGGLYWFPIGDVNDIFNLDSSNSLLLEIRFTSRVPTAWNLIMDTDYDSGLTRIYSQSFGASSGSLSNGYGLVTKFDLESGIPADVRVEPQSLNLGSMGNYVSFKVEGFPENPEYTPMDVDASSVAVADVGADLKYATYNNNRYIGKADRLLVEDAIGAPGAEVELEFKGKLNDGTAFMGIATIKAIEN